MLAFLQSHFQHEYTSQDLSPADIGRILMLVKTALLSLSSFRIRKPFLSVSWNVIPWVFLCVRGLLPLRPTVLPQHNLWSSFSRLNHCSSLFTSEMVCRSFAFLIAVFWTHPVCPKTLKVEVKDVFQSWLKEKVIISLLSFRKIMFLLISSYCVLI